MSETKNDAIDAANLANSVAGTTAAGRIAAALKDGNETRGWRGPDDGKREGKVKIVQRQHVALTAGDVLELCQGCQNQEDPIVASQTMGCSKVPPDTEVTIYADDAFYLLDQAAIVPMPAAKPVK